MRRKAMVRVYWTLVFGDVDFSNRLWLTRQEARIYKRETGFAESRVTRVRVTELRSRAIEGADA